MGIEKYVLVKKMFPTELNCLKMVETVFKMKTGQACPQ